MAEAVPKDSARKLVDNNFMMSISVKELIQIKAFSPMLVAQEESLFYGWFLKVRIFRTSTRKMGE